MLINVDQCRINAAWSGIELDQCWLIRHWEKVIGIGINARILIGIGHWSRKSWLGHVQYILYSVVFSHYDCSNLGIRPHLGNVDVVVSPPANITALALPWPMWPLTLTPVTFDHVPFDILKQNMENYTTWTRTKFPDFPWSFSRDKKSFPNLPYYYKWNKNRWLSRKINFSLTFPDAGNPDYDKSYYSIHIL